MIRRRANVDKRTSARRKKRKANMRRCDAVFSKLVRASGVCDATAYLAPGAQYVSCAGPLQCAHIVSRRYRAVRWSKDNALCLCAAHHTYWTFRPLEFERFVLDTIGPDAYDDLKRRALVVTRVDYEQVLSSLEAA